MGYAHASTHSYHLINTYLFTVSLAFLFLSLHCLLCSQTAFQFTSTYDCVRFSWLCLASCLKNDFLPFFLSLDSYIFFLILSFLILIWYQYVVRVLSSVKYQELLYANSLGGRCTVNVSSANCKQHQVPKSKKKTYQFVFSYLVPDAAIYQLSGGGWTINILVSATN